MNFTLFSSHLLLAETAEDTTETVADPSFGSGEPAVAVDPTAGSVVTLDGIAGTVMVIITMLVGLVANWLRQKYKLEGAKLQIDTSKSLMEQRNFIIDQRLIPFAISTGEHWLLTQLPVILKDATDGNGFQWKDHWKNLRDYVRGRILSKFLAENVDLIKFMGEKELDDLLDRLLMKLISKLPEGVRVLLPAEAIDALTNKLTSKATEFVIEKGQSLLTPKS